MSGCVVGIGTGPGDPDLLTLRAVRRLAAVDLVVHLSAAGRPSRARACVAPHLRPGTAEWPVALDMGPDRSAVAAAYDQLAARLRVEVDLGRNAAVLCEGDPLLFGSFVHLLARLDGVPVEIVPGLPSPIAAAASLRWPMATGSDGIAILPATMGIERLRTHLRVVHRAAVVKVGRHLAEVRALLAELRLLDDAWLAVEVSTPEERLVRVHDWPHAAAPYFALVLTRGLGADG